VIFFISVPFKGMNILLNTSVVSSVLEKTQCIKLQKMGLEEVLNSLSVEPWRLVLSLSALVSATKYHRLDGLKQTFSFSKLWSQYQGTRRPGI
jgi:hypothetical protein